MTTRYSALLALILSLAVTLSHVSVVHGGCCAMLGCPARTALLLRTLPNPVYLYAERARRCQEDVPPLRPALPAAGCTWLCPPLCRLIVCNGCILHPTCAFAAVASVELATMNRSTAMACRLRASEYQLIQSPASHESCSGACRGLAICNSHPTHPAAVPATLSHAG